MILVVGATGQLGSMVVGELGRQGRPVRAMARPPGHTIEDRGVMMVPGAASVRNAFISVHDMAQVMVAAVDARELTRPVDVGGPEIRTWTDVARIYGEVLGRPVKVLSTPAGVYAFAQRALSRVAPSASNTLTLNRLLATAETP